MYMDRSLSFVKESQSQPHTLPVAQASPWMPYRVQERAKTWEILVELRCVDSSMIDISLEDNHVCINATLLGEFWLPSRDSFEASKVTQRIPLPDGAIPGSLKAHQFKDLLTITFDKAVIPEGQTFHPICIEDQ